REHVKVDRVACPWLITRFIDPEARFLFVPEDDLLCAARCEGATPFDAPRLSSVVLNHRGRRCSFEAILEDYRLTDPVLARLGLIVRAADVKGQEDVATEGSGLRAIATGCASIHSEDDARLLAQFPLYDALYAYCQQMVRAHGPSSVRFHHLRRQFG